MNFSVYLPPKAEDEGVKLPVLYWLSGLTCNEQNFIQKAGGQSLAASQGFIVVCPNTSPSLFYIVPQYVQHPLLLFL